MEACERRHTFYITRYPNHAPRGIVLDLGKSPAASAHSLSMGTQWLQTFPHKGHHPSHMQLECFVCPRYSGNQPPRD